MLARTGSGYCGFSLDYSLEFDMDRSFAFTAGGDLTTYIDRSVARAGNNVVCAASAASLNLSYSASMTGPEGPQLRTIHGALAR